MSRRSNVTGEMVSEYVARVQGGERPGEILHEFCHKWPEVWDTFRGTNRDSARRSKMRKACVRFGHDPETFKCKESGPVPKSHQDFVDLKPDLIIPFEDRIAVASDAHCPVHSVEAMERLIQVVKAQEIPTVIFNGDQLNNDYKGHRKIHEVYQAPFLKGVQALCDFMEALMDAGVTKMIFVMGNHDDKPLRGTDGELSFSDWWKIMVFDRTSKRAEFIASDRYYVTMEPRDPSAPKTSPDHYDWQFTHQSNYGQIPLSVGRKISANKISNVVTGHQHHMAVGKAPNNAMWLVDAGCLADPKLAGYKEMRHSGHPEWTPGFVTVIHGVPEIWDLTNPEEWWEEYLG